MIFFSRKSKLNIFAPVFKNVINLFYQFMNKRQNIFLFLASILILISCSSDPVKKNTYIELKTTLGNITLRLYNETPVHRDNFIKLVNSHVFDDVTFHRVIKDFMIQTGDPETKTGYIRKNNDTLTTYTIPAEFNPSLFHKRGALAAAREGNDINPEMRSSGTQFYIVQGIRYTDETLKQAEERIRNNKKQALYINILKQISDSNTISGSGLKESEIQEKATLRMFEIMSSEPAYSIPESQKEVYKTLGGVPRLDGTYTVFGEVIDGMDIVDRIASVKTNDKDKPESDIRIIKAHIVRR
jgi:cyclophilin family peptidyl-prolyl cis-trans isomerase